MNDLHAPNARASISLVKDLKEKENTLAGACENKVLDKWSVDVQTKLYHRY